MRLVKIKRPGGAFWYDLEMVLVDEDGTWLHGPVGSRWGAPHDSGTLPVAVLLLLALDRPWVAWWVDDPTDRRLEIDVCRPPELFGSEWRYIDLELDPVRHEQDGRIEIEDWDEYEQSLRDGWMSPDDGRQARSTAEDLAWLLRSRNRPCLERGWQLLSRVAR